MEIYVTHTNAGLSLIREKTGIEATKITGEIADYTKTRTKRWRKQNYMQYKKQSGHKPTSQVLQY